MDKVLNKQASNDEAIKAKPTVVSGWLEDVTSHNGSDDLAEANAKL